MSSISFQEIQNDPLAFLRRMEAGETFLVVHQDRPVAEVKPVSADIREPRPFGLCAGQIHLPDDFDEPLPDEILKDFEGQ